jgi:uncharacterized protein (TIGR02284 family)
MEIDKTIDVLNKLVEINNDRIEGYQTASKETVDSGLITLFMQFVQISEKCNQELSSEIFRLGGTPTEETKISGKVYRTWMDIKSSINGHDRIALLKSCEFGEENAVETYENVLKDDLEYLNEEQLTMVSSQFALIKADHTRLKSILEAQEVGNYTDSKTRFKSF